MKALFLFQSTLTHREWQNANPDVHITSTISIHTPALGVTFGAISRNGRMMISIHTPALGVTRHGEYGRRQLQISIHTPALGVTASRWQIWESLIHFNPHSRTGSDQIESVNNNLIPISIHTPALGVTEMKASEFYKLVISIHTPALGATGMQ